MTVYEDEQLRAGVAELEAGRHTIALEHFAQAAEQAADPEERRAALAFAADATLALQRPYEAIAWAERLREASPQPDEADVLEAAAWVALGDGTQALECLDGVTAPDTPFKSYPSSVLHQLRCEAYRLVGDPDSALREAVEALREAWALPEVWRALAGVAERFPVAPDAATDLVPDDGLLQVLGWLHDAPPNGADRLVEALWNRWPDDRRILALATSLGNQLPLERAVEWSGRLRAAGLASECSVLGIAARDDLPARDRIRAASVAANAFHDDRAVPLLEVATAHLDDGDVLPALEEVLELAPDDLVDAFVVSAATSPRRCLLLAGALWGRGAQAPATALARHAAELTTGDAVALHAAVADTLEPDALDALAGALRETGAVAAAEALAGR